MKFLLIQSITLIGSVIILMYLNSLDYFLPFNTADELNWYNLSVVLSLLFFALESLISLFIYLVQKFLAFGWKEFPDYRMGLKWGLGISLSFMLILLLNSFHILTIQWGLILIALVIITLLVI